MPAEIAKRAFENFYAAQFHDFFLLVDRNRGVFHQRIKQVGRHALICIPIAGIVLEAGEEERQHGGRMVGFSKLFVNGRRSTVHSKIENMHLNMSTDQQLAAPNVDLEPVDRGLWTVDKF